MVRLPLRNGTLEVSSRIPLDAGQQLLEIKKFSDEWAQIAGNRKDYRTLYIMLMVLITLFVLFVATWLARILANRISTPIAAILEAAGEVRRGNLKHRVTVRAEDELALLVNGFNQMTEALESSGIELDRRRRFTEAILESIPTGVISIASDGSIQHVNRALAKIFPGRQAARATRLEDLFSREDTTELKYLMKRARRTGVASRQLELRTDQRKIHLAVTVAALESKADFGLRRGPRRYQRAAARAEGGGLARSGAARGARDQEPADADRAFGRAHRPPARPPGPAAGHRADRLRVRRHHHANPWNP